MGSALHANRAASTLAGAITNVAVSLSVAPGTGSRFPAPAAGQYFGIVIQNGDNDSDAREYCYCTARVGDVLTVVRGQEGTVGTAFAIGATVAQVILAGEFDTFAQKNGDQLTAQLDEASPVTLATAATVNIGAAASNTVLLTGSAGVTSLGPGVTGMRRRLYSAAGVVFTNGATLVLPGFANMTLAAGEWAEFFYNGTAWFCTKAPSSATPATADNSTKNATTAWCKAGFAIQLAVAGYIKFPSWLNNLTIQWGSTVGNTNGASAVAITFPIAFTNGYAAVASNGDSGTTLAHPTSTGVTLTGFTAVWTNGVGGVGAGIATRTNWLAVGTS